ncbi:MAG: valine--tRNA ligase [Sedimentisphaerales bacterium]|nr:valine--tRNA ligase [Sedimentisphaerales bacterium]
MSQELSKIYEPQQVESQAYKIWQQSQAFHPDPANSAPAYTIVIPPPNVTAPLHLGHALNNTLQDILIRWRRMQQRNTLWMPGTDHAGIATQTVVEKRILAEEGKKRTDFQREEFVGRVQQWKDEYEARIIEQLQRMGCSCDWERTRFTMDDVCAKAVRATFFKLFQDGLIYRGKRLVNWDPATQTVLADDEVEHETIDGHFWYLQYPLEKPVEYNGQKIEHVTVATTRPETMLGDTAVAISPRDPRADALVGQNVRLPIVDRLIPIVADDHVVLPDPESDDEKAKFSTGFLKVTPAHDTNDWAIGLRHDLPVINIMAPDGSISDKHGWEDCTTPEAQNLVGMDRFEAREAIVNWFRNEKLLEDVRDYAHEVGHSYRSHVPIEPYLSDQWYIAVKKPIPHLAEKFGSDLLPDTDVPANSLAGLALKPLLDNRLKFTPDRYANNYQTWLENLRDWPISRQLWWGHQIPVWSKPGKHENRCEYGTFSVQGETDQGPVTYACVKPGFEELEKAMIDEGWQQDPDVLDTWFSSALWPFSTMGWPEETPELKSFYPGDVLCTAREIITLWVSRMVMMGQYCMGDIPFADVFIHAMIQDGQGRKMSKSLGNGIDPLVVIDSHGCDAMRFTLASMTTQTQDVRMPVEPMKLPDGRTVNTSPKFDIGRNFCNKLWNASRFALANLADFPADPPSLEDLTLEDKWILARLAATISEVTQQLEEFRFSDPINQLYRFFWNELCDWYLELVKPRMRDDARKPVAQYVLAAVLDASLRLLHPFLPFITEGIYQNLNQLCPNRDLPNLLTLGTADCIASAPWPAAADSLVNPEIENQMNLIQSVIRLVRDTRTRYQIAPRQPLTVSVKAAPALCDLLNNQAQLINDITSLEAFTAAPDTVKPDDAAVAVSDELEIYIHGVIDPQAERDRLTQQKQDLEKQLQSVQAKLANENFVTRAKPEVVQVQRDKAQQLQEQLASVQNNLDALS